MTFDWLSFLAGLATMGILVTVAVVYSCLAVGARTQATEEWIDLRGPQ